MKAKVAELARGTGDLFKTIGIPMEKIANSCTVSDLQPLLQDQVAEQEFGAPPAKRRRADEPGQTGGGLNIECGLSIYSIELCCGKAGLSAALGAAGFVPIAADYERNPNKQPSVSVTIADLSTRVGQTVVDDLEKKFLPQVWHIAPPCGTASRARDKKIPSWLKAKGAPRT